MPFRPFDNVDGPGTRQTFQATCVHEEALHERPQQPHHVCIGTAMCTYGARGPKSISVDYGGSLAG